MHIEIVAPEWAEKLVSDLTDMDRDPRQVEPGERVRYELPDDAYFEYAFVDGAGKVRPDPANEQRAKSVWYGEVSYVTGPDYEPDELAEPPAELAEGTTDRLKLESSSLHGQTRRVAVYTPSGVDPDTETALAVVQDGVAMMRLGGLHLMLEALLARGDVEPVRLAFLEPVDRLSEYAFNDQYMSFVEDEVEAELADRYPLSRRRLWVGASLGALASASLGLRRAEREPEAAADDAVLTLSGAFLGTPDDFHAYRSDESWLVDRLGDGGAPVPGNWHLHVGTLEWLHDVNTEARQRLQARGDARVSFTQSHAGHNWPNWKNALPDALRAVL